MDRNVVPGDDEVATLPPEEPNHGPLRISAWFYGTWFAIGCLAFAFDDMAQPVVASFGRNPVLHSIAEYWQQLAEMVGIIGFVAVMLTICRHSLKPALAALAGVAVTVQVMKHLIGRVRPNWTGDTTVIYGPLGVFNEGALAHIDSLPSGHTAVAFAMAQVLSFSLPFATWLWFSMAVGVALARTLLDVHFPSDVIFGALLGTLIGRFACSRISNTGDIPTARREARQAAKDER